MEENKNIPANQTTENVHKNITPSEENNLPDTEIIATAKPEIINPEPETTDMEVHHHTHPGHHKKKWTDYFWEFLMLFLAVFCGFLAEYQLEHKIEKDRELQYIKSLVSDLQDDVKNLDVMIGFEHRQVEKLDTLIDLLNNPSAAKQQGDQLYYVARVGPRSQPFANNSRTFDQLKNSGGFRLIRNPEASNNIMAYYNEFSPIRLLEDNFNHEFDNYKRVAAKIFDPGILRKQEAADGEIRRSNFNPALTTYDPGLLKELGFHTLQMNGSRRSKVLMLENLEKTAANVLAFLKDKYQLE